VEVELGDVAVEECDVWTFSVLFNKNQDVSSL